MNIKPIEDILGAAPSPLTMLPLRALDPVREPYLAMLLQPQGEIEANEKRIGHAKAKEGHQVCAGFLGAAIDKSADLVVAPEYCIPWSVIDEVINGTRRPAAGAIWILGCESIAPKDLESLANTVNTAKLGFFYHEPIDAIQAARKTYADPLLYVFWSKTAENQPILCFVVQLKTAACKDYFDVEQLSLYVGQAVYSFNRGLNKIGLLTIICSDAFHFSNALVDDYHANCLLIHIQLNPKPAHAEYAAYRARLCSVASGREVELLCVNWARNVREIKDGGKAESWNNVAGSAWYVPLQKFSGADQLIDEAHKNGIYYCILAKRWHVFFLNYDSQIILFKKQKLLLHGLPQVLQTSTCLAVEERWSWNRTMNMWDAGSVADDGFAALMSTYATLESHLPLEVKASPLGVERALEILMGPRGKVSSWFSVAELPSLHVDADESIRRVTVHQEDNAASPGLIFRRARLQRAEDAITLPGNGVPWPAATRDLEGGFKFRWRLSAPHHNVIPSTEGRGSAALVYLGEETDENVVKLTHQKLLQGICKDAVDVATRENRDVKDAVVLSADRLCVVYRRAHAYKTRGPNGLNFIDRPADESAVDITGDRND